VSGVQASEQHGVLVVTLDRPNANAFDALVAKLSKTA
jgi:enoyl-CoA hydratase/carnithine racemase